MADKVATDFLSQVKAKSKQAMDWFKTIVSRTRRAAFPARTARDEIMQERNVGIDATPKIGRMYLFQYDAKWKDILPYWDVWPLIFPFDYTSNGFYGINLHYLPPNDRINLMLRLIKSAGSSANVTDKYRLKLSYQIITGFKPAVPCIKRYLFSHVQGSGFYGISGTDWSYAATLPLQKFKGAGTKTIWSDSKQFY
jgi:hypothetical protein